MGKNKKLFIVFGLIIIIFSLTNLNTINSSTANIFDSIKKIFDNSTTNTNTTSSPLLNLSFTRVNTLSPSYYIITKAPHLSLTALGFPWIDFNKDGLREFVTRRNTGDIWNTIFDIFENSGDNSFTAVSSVIVPGQSSYHPADVGDSDKDGSDELLVYGRTGNNFYTRLYEAPSLNGYPQNVSWETQTDWWTVGAKIDDMDKDGKKEIIFAGQDYNYEKKIHVYENTGNNSYSEVYSTFFPEAEMNTAQCFNTMDDLDGDGKKEMIFTGLGPNSVSTLYMYENTGNNSFAQIWSHELKHNNVGVNCGEGGLVYVGDTNGNGKKEFIVGGLGAGTLPYYDAAYLLFESTGDNTFEKIGEFSKQLHVYGSTAGNSYDLDGDGLSEIIISSEDTSQHTGVYVFKNDGNNNFSEIWNYGWYKPGNVGEYLNSIGVGDHDGDTKPELIFSEYINGLVKTSIFESN